MIKNAEGIKAHVTDDFVHWSGKDRVKKMYEVRLLYILALEGDEKSLNELLSRAFETGMKEKEFALSYPVNEFE